MSQEIGRFLAAVGNTMIVIAVLLVVLRIVGWLTGA